MLLSPRAILEFWESIHGGLSDSSKLKFFNRSEILILAILPEFHVRQSIRMHAKLEKILLNAKKSASQDDTLSELERLNLESSDRSNAIFCEHGLNTFSPCDACRFIRPIIRTKIVWQSAGGGKFHYTKDCEWARIGQESFAARGGTPLHWYPAKEAISRWARKPCVTCVIKSPLEFEWFTE